MSEADETSVKIDVEENEDGNENDEQSNANEDGLEDTDSLGSQSKSVPTSATSVRSNLSRKGSAKSQKSVAWSTGASSEKGLLEDNNNGKKGGILFKNILSGKVTLF